ncbi:hypothetical protein RCL_jg28284.t1 [Rhizophagus clarus]|uniref:Uncharacterized protein n=1 Tax=Rhizophagus clarus TaxID=94130 RepID=A0A8H3LXG5_9GLOM|nr:hypothetical protein RCL_jg28284.t1 [Rhizophagus clarus]
MEVTNSLRISTLAGNTSGIGSSDELLLVELSFCNHLCHTFVIISLNSAFSNSVLVISVSSSQPHSQQPSS